jgi:hypothetical protein
MPGDTLPRAAHRDPGRPASPGAREADRQRVKLQNFVKQELAEKPSKCSVCWQVLHSCNCCDCWSIVRHQATCANWEFVSCLVICCLVWAGCLFLWAGCEVRHRAAAGHRASGGEVGGRRGRGWPARPGAQGQHRPLYQVGQQSSPSPFPHSGQGRQDSGALPTDAATRRPYFPSALQVPHPVPGKLLPRRAAKCS